MTSLAAAPRRHAHAAPTRPRRSLWPYAGIVSALASGASGVALVQGPGTFRDTGTWASTDFVVANLNPRCRSGSVRGSPCSASSPPSRSCSG